ncbi:unnamed protein product [Dracunculus medinensis]|uniref:Guanine nucleotide-binding protein-like 3 homolog n=1 Tax=Dracunculus medinensis TaxID=318479 RepID=A0A158Q2X2_DRAME|nr:unnamed protein product [Dracunculus medinensis]
MVILIHKAIAINFKRKKKSKREKPIHVPNKCPFKEEVLLEAERARENMEKIKEEKKRLAKQRRFGEKNKLFLPNSIEDFANNATQRDINFSQKNSSEIEENKKLKNITDKQINMYANEVRKTIESADIVIEVLDARDPLGSRNQNVEHIVVSSGKRLVLLLNKIDLVPKDNVYKWLKYLRTQFPTIAFKASTQEQSHNLGRFSFSTLRANRSKCFGAEIVMNLLGNYCRNKNTKMSVRVAVVGYPNVGKSSVINSLKRKRVCDVGAIPGITKQSQEVELDKHIHLLDSPGVILANKNELDNVEYALKNAIRIDNLSDPITPVQAILRRCSKDMLMLHYSIANFENVDDFLAQIARKIGRLKKGARPDINAAAKRVLYDWNNGKLRYYTEPPEAESEQTINASVILNEFSSEFDLDSLKLDEEKLFSVSIMVAFSIL